MSSFDSRKAMEAAVRADALQHQGDEGRAGSMARGYGVLSEWRDFLGAEFIRHGKHDDAMISGIEVVAHMCAELMVNGTKGDIERAKIEGGSFFKCLVDFTIDHLDDYKDQIFAQTTDQSP